MHSGRVTTRGNYGRTCAQNTLNKTRTSKLNIYM
ncbi:hypothetical protein RSOL_450330 [Rhizoctonia solani AG-3 Rhs1AP]|uniref:Uncharacterized protein n=1 Tax=Rhizoctonia solani AG-3 Rhs1AP TaxID=1086054 RepID=X8JR25_9AGAM|nr:hypothetical protein RSOL_450330 [Rhizoctonia solani AG-3 Rhs1AP]